MTRLHGWPACVYCGAPIRDGRTCAAHRDLEQLDPAALAERQPASEGDLGVRPWYALASRRRRRRS